MMFNWENLVMFIFPQELRLKKENIIPQFQLYEIIEKYPIIGSILNINSSF